MTFYLGLDATKNMHFFKKASTESALVALAVIT